MPQFITKSKMLSAISTVLLLIVGWLFNTVIDIQRDTREVQGELAKKVAVLESQYKYLIKESKN